MGKNQALEDMSALTVVKIFILTSQLNLYHHAADAENVLMKKNRVVRNNHSPLKGEIMEFSDILEKLNEKNVSEITLVTREGDETLISKKDHLETKGEYLLITRNNKEIQLILDDVYKMIVTKKAPTSTKIYSLPRKGMRNRY